MTLHTKTGHVTFVSFFKYYLALKSSMLHLTCTFRNGPDSKHVGYLISDWKWFLKGHIQLFRSS